MKVRRITSGNRVSIHVWYESGRERSFTEKDNLPITVVSVLLDGECFREVYRGGCKIEDFRG